MCARFLVVHYKIPEWNAQKTARALTNSRASPLAWAINIKAVATRRAGISPAGIRVCHGSARRDVLGVRPETTRATLWQRPTRCMDNGCIRAHVEQGSWTHRAQLRAPHWLCYNSRLLPAAVQWPLYDIILCRWPTCSGRTSAARKLPY